MRPLYRLHSKLSLAVLLLLIVLGGVLLSATSTISERHSLEVTQRLNRDIAIHAAEDMPLFENGEVNQQALKDLAHHVMFINPIVEVYLLDPEGRILSHALPYETVLLEQVNMAPLHAFITQSRELPIFGDDPRNPGEQKVFSISPVLSEGEPAGYLYTVLNGRSYQSLRESLQDSYNLRAGAQTIIGSLLVAVLMGFLIFSLLTRRLQTLMINVRQYRDSSFEGDMPDTGRTPPRDEIDELGNAIHDMSSRIDKQFQLRQEADKTRRELVANVSHDLRTPLASMQGYLETLLLKQGELDDQQKQHYLEIAHKHSKRLNELVQELFELSKLESSNTEPKWESFPVMELIQDTMQDFELRAAERGISLSAECADKTVVVYADIAMIHRVLENLLENAIRHTPRDGEVVLMMREDEQRVRIEVKDNGQGIAAHDIPHIFDRFYRPEANAEESAGHGLGLAIVKKILELHRSTVDVYSEPNRGTAFVFWLPRTALTV